MVDGVAVMVVAWWWWWVGGVTDLVEAAGGQAGVAVALGPDVRGRQRVALSVHLLPNAESAHLHRKHPKCKYCVKSWYNTQYKCFNRAEPWTIYCF